MCLNQVPTAKRLIMRRCTLLKRNVLRTQRFLRTTLSIPFYYYRLVTITHTVTLFKVTALSLQCRTQTVIIIMFRVYLCAAISYRRVQQQYTYCQLATTRNRPIGNNVMIMANRISTSTVLRQSKHASNSVDLSHKLKLKRSRCSKIVFHGVIFSSIVYVIEHELQ